MKSTHTALRFAISLLVIAGASLWSADARVVSIPAKSIETNLKGDYQRAHTPGRPIKLRLFFTNPNHPDFANTCGAGEFVERTIPATKRLADAALRLLFAGPNAQEKAKGMESLERLGRYYLGVSVKRGVAVVNFRPEAEEILQGTACEQEQRLTPIHKTLTQFGTIKRVEYAINGKIIEEWDA